MRYLKGAKELGLRYGPLRDHEDGGLIGFTDSSHGDCLDTCRSTSGYIFFLYNGPVSWASKRQATVANSTTEAEYIGECNAAKESVFLAGSLKGLGYEGPDLNIVLLMADNQAAIKLAINPVNHLRVKHIDIQFRKVRELIFDNVLKLVYIPTEEMIADGLTKPLTLPKHEFFLKMLGLTKIKPGWPCRFRTERGVLVFSLTATSMLYSKLYLTVPMLFTLIVIISLLIIVGLTNTSISLKVWMRYLRPRHRHWSWPKLSICNYHDLSWRFIILETEQDAKAEISHGFQSYIRALIPLVFNLEEIDRKLINPTTDWHTHIHLPYMIIIPCLIVTFQHSEGLFGGQTVSEQCENTQWGHAVTWARQWGVTVRGHSEELWRGQIVRVHGEETQWRHTVRGGT